MGVVRATHVPFAQGPRTLRVAHAYLDSGRSISTKRKMVTRMVSARNRFVRAHSTIQICGETKLESLALSNLLAGAFTEATHLCS